LRIELKAGIAKFWVTGPPFPLTGKQSFLQELKPIETNRIAIRNFEIDRVHLKSQKHVRCETRGFFDVQIVLQNTLNEADGVLLAKPNSRKQ